MFDRIPDMGCRSVCIRRIFVCSDDTDCKPFEPSGTVQPTGGEIITEMALFEYFDLPFALFAEAELCAKPSNPSKSLYQSASGKTNSMFVNCSEMFIFGNFEKTHDQLGATGH